VRSLHKKIIVKGYSDPWGDVKDKVGVRAVVQSPRDVNRLRDCLIDKLGDNVLSVEDKRQIANPALLGYGGVHVNVLSAKPSPDREPVQCEIQLRTTAQDAWSVVSHQSLYKPMLSLPPELQHAAYRLVALVEMFDEEVQRILDAIPTLPGFEVADLLEIAEGQFLEVAHSPSDRELSIMVLEAIVATIDKEERQDYGLLLESFVAIEGDRLRALYREYGAHSAASYVPEYVLLGQAESLVVLERLILKPHKLAAAWHTSGLPWLYLEGLAGAAGVALPEHADLY
jgi:hypothetical protein